MATRPVDDAWRKAYDGAAGSQVPASQLPETRVAAYLVVQFLSVSDPAKLEEYRQKVRATQEPYGAQVRVLGGKADVLEGDWQPTLTIVEFPSIEQARAWYESEAYQPLKALTQGAIDRRMILVEGV
jgi:uncharacterized protein (DUF1330 family)